MDKTNEKTPPMRVLVLIINADKSAGVSKLFSGLPSHIQYQFHADGTATSDILDILGLGVAEKVVTLMLLPTVVAKQLLHGVSAGLALHMPGKGVAFTIPVSGIVKRALAMIISDDDLPQSDDTGNEVNKMEVEIRHHLILAAVNQGYSDAITDTAKQAGATGGTVWTARKSGLGDPSKLLGSSMQDGREIVAILAAKDKKTDIMKALNAVFGVSSKAQGIILSLPVDCVAGLGEMGIE